MSLQCVYPGNALHLQPTHLHPSAARADIRSRYGIAWPSWVYVALFLFEHLAVSRVAESDPLLVTHIFKLPGTEARRVTQLASTFRCLSEASW